MKNIYLLFFSVFFSITVFCQGIPEPSIWYISNFNKVSLSGSGGSLFFEGDSSLVYSDFINGYPAVRIDSAGGYFSFTSDALAGKGNVLFISVYQPDVNDYQREHGLWTLRNGIRSRSLTSEHIVEGKHRIRYNEFPFPDVSVTTNYVGFRNFGISNMPVSAVDTFYIGKADSILFSGKISEFLVIDTSFNAVERQVWQSYLSLKYGVTIFAGDYVNSSGDTLWFYRDNVDFSSGVGGIGRDEAVRLRQNFSRIYGDSVRLAFSGHINDAQQSAQTPFDDKEYIFWGHSGNPVQIGNATCDVDDKSYILYQRKWKLKTHLQSDRSVDIEVFSSSVFKEHNDSKDLDLKLFVSDNAGFNSFGTRIYSADIIEDNRRVFSDIIFTANPDIEHYFTFGYGTEDLNGFMNSQAGHLTNNCQNSSTSADNPALKVFTEARYMPNPVTDNLYVDYKLTRAAVIWFSVHNNSGVPMYQTSPATMPEGQNRAIIPMSGFIGGTYTVYAHIDDMTLSQVVIKQ